MPKRAKKRSRRTQSAPQQVRQEQAETHASLLAPLAQKADSLTRYAAEVTAAVERFRRTEFPEVFTIHIDAEEFILDETFRWPVDVAGRTRFFEFSRMFSPSEGVTYWVTMQDRQGGGDSDPLHGVAAAEILGVVAGIQELYAQAAEFGLVEPPPPSTTQANGPGAVRLAS